MTTNDDVSMAGPRLAIHVAELIRAAHDRAGLSHEQIATLLGVSVGRVSQIINGDGNFHIATVGRIFAALGCELSIHATDASGIVEPARRARRRNTSTTTPTDRAAIVRTALADDQVHGYHMSVVGEGGGMDGVFFAAHVAGAQTLAGGRMTPLSEPSARPKHASTKLTTSVELPPEPVFA